MSSSQLTNSLHHFSGQVNHQPDIYVYTQMQLVSTSGFSGMIIPNDFAPINIFRRWFNHQPNQLDVSKKTLPTGHCLQMFSLYGSWMRHGEEVPYLQLSPQLKLQTTCQLRWSKWGFWNVIPVQFGGFLKWGYPIAGWFIVEILLKWMIWEYPYFRMRRAGRNPRVF